jgi:hypothetical protein
MTASQDIAKRQGPLSDAELQRINETTDFRKDGCLWPKLTTEQLKDLCGLKRTWTGGKGGTGTLTGYERV